MASGDVSLINHGMHSVSGSSLISAVAAIGAVPRVLSGAGLHLVPVANGQQIALYEVAVAV